MQDGFDPDILAGIFDAIALGIDGLLNATIDTSNADSVIMAGYSLVPVVGSNPLDATTFLLLLAVIGVLVGFRKWFG